MKGIILLSGPPGAGKTTVARELIEISAGRVAHIEGDKFWSFFVKGWEGLERGENFKTMIVSMITASLAYARAGYEVIVDFSIPPSFLEAAGKIIVTRDIPLHYVVLRPSEKVCAERAAMRTEGKIDDYAAYKDFYRSFDDAECYSIHDDECDAATTAISIRNGLDEGVFRVLN